MTWPDASKIRDVRWWEYGVRFLVGGLISAAAAVLGDALGDKVGGAMLAFPAILPASLTLVGKKDGRQMAEQHAEGAPFGGLGLVTFAAALWAAARPLAGWGLLVGLAAWTLAGVGGFELWLRLQRPLLDRGSAYPGHGGMKHEP